MRINTNVAAINAQRNLGMTQDMISDSMAKLSSGFRINRAGDDAAGLGIANKLRADTRALTQASRNAEQANSLLQVAEGAGGTVQKMLERMKELATESASDNTDAAGRTRIQQEFSTLRSEISRTVATTQFQGKTLLDGQFGASATGTFSNAGSGVYKVDLTGAAAATYTLTADNTAGTITLASSLGTSQVLTGYADATAASYNFGNLGVSVSTDSSVVDSTVTGSTVVVSTGTNGGAFMIGSSGQYTGNDMLTLAKLDLGVSAAASATGLNISADTLATQAGAQAALANIDTSIGRVADVLGTIGAAQNRIQYATDNLKTTIQNYSAAESVIRDLDMAEEMTKFSKANILAQAGTAMLAQANQSSQSVLTLLRG